MLRGHKDLFFRALNHHLVVEKEGKYFCSNKIEIKV